MTRTIASFLRDLRHAVRVLRHTPWYATSAIAILAIGIALATVVFAIVDGVLFKPLPYPGAGELYLVRVDVAGAPRPEPPAITGREVEAWTAAAPDAMLTRIGRRVNAVAAIGAREYYATTIDAQFFDVLDLRPWLGGFTADDFVPRPPQEMDRDRFPRALISHGLWLTATGGNPAIVGGQLALNRAGDRGVRVAGVLPRDFVFPLNVFDHTATIRQPDVLLPMPAIPADNRDWPEFLVLARAGPHEFASVRDRLRGATLELTRNPPVVEIHHDDQRRPPYDVVELDAVTSLLGRRERPTFSLVTAATGLLLALVCVNLAGLTTARCFQRHRELVIRRALGATGWHLARGLLAEWILLAGAGAAVALAIAPALLSWTIGLLPETVTLLKPPALDARVFVAAALLAFASAGLVVAWPAIVATRLSAFSGSRGLSAAATRSGVQSGLALLATQGALGFVLLTAGGLTLASIAAAWRSDVGYRRDRVVIFEAFLKDSAAITNDSDHVIALHDALRRVPDVANVAATDSSLQLFVRNSVPWSAVKAAGTPAAPKGLASRSVSVDLFDVMGLQFVAGDQPSAGEWSANRVAVVSEAAARLLWADRSAIGQDLEPVRPNRGRNDRWRVIGVVRDARYRAIDQEPVADVYLPDRIEGGRYGAFFLVQSSATSETLIPALTAVATARGFFTQTVAPLDDALFATMRPRFLPAWLFGSLGIVAVVVLAAGVFGLLAMSAAQRTRELVIRVALGATYGRVLRLLARDQLLAVAIGLSCGALVSLWATQLLQGHLYGVTPREPAIWVAVALLMLIVSAVGAWIPAARAARANPADALRAE